MEDWMQRHDEGGRMSYPPLPTKGGNVNAEAQEGIVQGVLAVLSRTRAQEAEFRARQYARRLKTRGKAAMRDPMPQATVTLAPSDLPDDPVAQAYAAAGWL